MSFAQKKEFNCSLIPKEKNQQKSRTHRRIDKREAKINSPWVVCARRMNAVLKKWLQPALSARKTKAIIFPIFT
jgi:hypothetical protein